MLEISDLSYRIKNAQVLSHLGLVIQRGQYYALAGENGAGKSTLIKIVLDLIRNTQGGEITINCVSNRAKSARESLVYLPEKFNVSKDVSGWQYLRFVLGVHRQREDAALIEGLCADLGLDARRLHDRAATYSKGMVQKLGLVSCFMLDKPLMILDEPLSGLDPAARYRFKKLLQKVHSQQRTIFYSTHMLADAEEICDRFAVLHKGAIRFEGSPQECLQHYQASTLEQAYMKCIAPPPADAQSAV